MTRFAIIGASGRMGLSLLQYVQPAQVSAAVVSSQNPHLKQDVSALLPNKAPWGVPLTDSVADAVPLADVVIDFSSVQLTQAVLESCVHHRVPLVLATTGLTDALEALVRTASESIPVLRAANTSLGVAVLAQAVQLVAQALPSEYQIEISEAHHQHKKDAPSGTALWLGETAATARGLASPTPSVRGAGERDPQFIGYSSIRAGEIVGEHTVWFVGRHERLELTHRALSRDVFASGALYAAHWLADKPPALYTMGDVLRG